MTKLQIAASVENNQIVSINTTFHIPFEGMTNIMCRVQKGEFRTKSGGYCYFVPVSGSLTSITLNEVAEINTIVTESVIDTMIDTINTIASDVNLNKVEKCVKITQDLSGTYVTALGTIVKVYRSPNNALLMAIRSDAIGANIIKVDLNPKQVLSYLQTI